MSYNKNTPLGNISLREQTLNEQERDVDFTICGKMLRQLKFQVNPRKAHKMYRKIRNESKYDLQSVDFTGTLNNYLLSRNRFDCVDTILDSISDPKWMLKLARVERFEATRVSGLREQPKGAGIRGDPGS